MPACSCIWDSGIIGLDENQQDAYKCSHRVDVLGAGNEMAIYSAYTTEQAAKVARVSPRRVSYWASSGVLVPSVLYDSDAIPRRALYSFADVVGLRTLGILRDRHGLSLQRLRQAADFLRSHADRPWSDLRLWVRANDLLFRAPATGALVSTGQPGQTAIAIEIEAVAHDAERASEALGQRDPADIGMTERRRGVQGNRLVVRGTRVPVESILNLASDGYSARAIVETFPSLTLGDVTAILTGQHAA